jgi:hypothetical protein
MPEQPQASFVLERKRFGARWEILLAGDSRVGMEKFE